MRSVRPGEARLACLLLVLVLAGCADEDQTAQRGSTPAPSIRISSTALPYRGTVPFLDVIADPHDPAAFVVQADLDRAVGVGCAQTVNRPVVQETSGTVTVSIAAYGRKPKPGTFCDGEGDREAIRIRLQSPLGSRRLIDATTGRRHPVLDPSTVPTVTSIPSNAVADPLRWIDSTGIATRHWQAGDTTVWMTVGDPDQIKQGAPVPSRLRRTVDIRGAQADIWHGGGPYDVVVVRWPISDGRTVEVRTVQDRPATGSVDRAIALARSVQ